MRHTFRNLLTVPVCLVSAVWTVPVLAQSCPAPQPLSNMSLTFDDEFVQGSTLNTNKWNKVAMGGADGYNHEQEAYVPAGVQMLPGGGLRLQANKENFWTNNYTSGEVTTYGHFAQAYGHFEMKAKLPDGNGLWPAFWLLPDNGSWPPEIDILEYVYAVNGALPGVNNAASGLFQTLHWGSNNSSQGFEARGDYGNTYHTYAVDWRPGSVVFLIDGVVKNCLIDTPTTGQRVPNSPMYMIANLAIGAQNSWTGSVTSATPFPANMDIAYIKAYQFNDVTPPPQEPILIVNPQVSETTAHVGDTVNVSVDVAIGNHDLPGSTQVQFFVGNFDQSKNYATLAQTGLAVFKAHQTYHFTVPFKITTATPPGIYTVQLGAFYNNWASNAWFSQRSFPPITVVANIPVTPPVAPAPVAALPCGNTPSGQTAWVNGSTGSSTAAASTAQCPFGGTVTTTWTNQTQQLCTNGVLSNTGQTQKVNSVTQNSCNAAAACGDQPSGQTWDHWVSNGTGTAPATTAQCANGGTVATQVNYYQKYLCTNGTLTPVGVQTSTATVKSWIKPVCKPATPAACGDQPSGQTWMHWLSNGTGTAAATAAQCPHGGTVTTQVNYYQNFLCTDGKLTAVGEKTSTATPETWIAPICK